jgi:threonine dehydrogenase-like Zn-dependent dehydrogenase
VSSDETRPPNGSAISPDTAGDVFIHEFSGDVGPVSVTTKQTGNTFVSTAVSSFGKTVVESKCGSSSHVTGTAGLSSKVRGCQ